MSWLKDLRASFNSMFDRFEKDFGDLEKDLDAAEKRLDDAGADVLIEEETRPDGTRIKRKIIRRTITTTRR